MARKSAGTSLIESGSKKARKSGLKVRVVSKAKNEILAAWAESCGSIKAAAKRIGVCTAKLSAWINFKSRISERDIRRRPDLFRSVIPALERETGHSVDEIFPPLSARARKFLATPRVSSYQIQTVRLESVVNRARLSYQTEYNEIDSLADSEEISERIKTAMKCLTYMERQVICMRHGIGHPHGADMTLAEIAAVIGRSRERVRQIEARALRKLRDPGVAKHIVSASAYIE